MLDTVENVIGAIQPIERAEIRRIWVARIVDLPLYVVEERSNLEAFVDETFCKALK